ncbi:MAG: glycosyltransferase [Pseudomonas sp.]
MRVLVLTAAQRLPDLSTFYAHLGEQLSLDIRRLTKPQQLDLRRTLRGVAFADYQRTLVDLPFRHIHRQGPFLATLPGVLFYEEDACQNYLQHARHYRQFSALYAHVPQARVVVTGAQLAQRLCAEGVDARFVAKGYDAARVYFEPGERDIELGFIGRLASAEYAERRRLLLRLMACEPLRLLRTEPGADYRRMLNRIRLFVSADIGLGEYMAKNFEAMACGCLLLAWRQGSEEQALGLREGEHLLLYSSLEELREHIDQLRADPQRLQRIASAGREWAQARRSYRTMAESVAQLLYEAVPAVAPLPQRSWWQLWRG